MRSLGKLFVLLLMIGASLGGAYGVRGLSQQAGSGSSDRLSEPSAVAFPKDVYPESGNRLPPIKREDLDDIGKKIFDRRKIEGYGPTSISLYSVTPAAYLDESNDYLHTKSGLERRLVELVILVMARELDSEWVWTAHEPLALQAGLQQETIDMVKYRRPITGLGEKEAVIIQLGREAIGNHRVSSDTASRGLKQFGNQGLVNVVSLMGDYSSLILLCTTFDQHLHPTDKPLLPIP